MASAAEMALRQPAAWPVVPAMTSPTGSVTDAVGPAISIPDPRIIRPLDHNAADERTRAVHGRVVDMNHAADNRPVNHVAVDMHNAADLRSADNYVSVVTVPTPPMISLGRGGLGEGSEEHSARKSDENLLELRMSQHVSNPKDWLDHAPRMMMMMLD
jgi:hypothetical protein